VDDRLQRDIFVIGLNDTFKHFRSDLVSRENPTTLTFAQIISKARDFEASLKTESAITRQQLEESVHQVTPGEDTAYKVTPDVGKSKTPRRSFKKQEPFTSQTHGALACSWCGRTPDATRRDCPAANDTCHRCGKRGHWQLVFQASTANAVTQVVDTVFEASTAHITLHDVA